MEKKPAQVGMRAPPFSMVCTRGSVRERQHVTQEEFLNRWLILLFYPRDFSLVCPTELIALSSRIAEFQKRDCDVIGISTDSLETHERWLTTPESLGGVAPLNIPLASDESGDVCAAYGVLVQPQNIALRGLFIIDPNGVLQYQVVHNLSVGRSADEVLRVLDALATGGYCPAGWTPGAPIIDPNSTLGPERVLGVYRIEAVVGSGTFGTVFRAWDTLLERRVALKVLSSGRSGSASELLAEARAAAGLNHPNICTVHAVEPVNPVPMIVMEYIEGRPLSAMLNDGPMPPRLATALAQQIASAMAAAHAQGVVHGDLKPANIMVTAGETAKVMDFGLSRRHSPTVSVDDSPTRGVTGTPAYMAPEQTRGEIASPASDVFALGLMLYEMVSGRKAIAAANVFEAFELVGKIEPASFALQTTQPFARILSRALINDPAKRTITMEEIAQLLA